MTILLSIVVVAFAAFLGSILGYRAGGRRMAKDLAEAAAADPNDLAAFGRITERAHRKALKP